MAMLPYNPSSLSVTMPIYIIYRWIWATVVVAAAALRNSVDRLLLSKDGNDKQYCTILNRICGVAECGIVD
jgi:hypothetical protein